MEINKETLNQVIGKSCNKEKKKSTYKGVADKQYWNTVAGYFNSAEGQKDNEEQFYCPKCKNREMYMQIKWENSVPYESAVICECVQERRSVRKLIESGLSPLIAKKFENFKVSNELQATIKKKAFANTKVHDWFFIGGQSGAGKTHICAAIGNELLEGGSSVEYMLWMDKVAELKANQMDYETHKKEIDRLKNIEVLYIDDLFKTKEGVDVTGADVRFAFEILNWRYNQKLKTIISTEKTIMEIEEIDTALAGRINEMARDYVLNIGKDSSRNFRLNGDFS